MARSKWVAHAFEWEKLLKCHLKGKASKKLANGQNIDYSEKRKRPKGFICPCTGVKYHNIQTCLLVYAADSGERLQDHWSSGLWSLFSSTLKKSCSILAITGRPRQMNVALSNEPRHKKTGFLPMRKQRRRSASQLPMRKQRRRSASQ